MLCAVVLQRVYADCVARKAGETGLQVERTADYSV